VFEQIECGCYIPQGGHHERDVAANPLQFLEEQAGIIDMLHSV